MPGIGDLIASRTNAGVPAEGAAPEELLSTPGPAKAAPVEKEDLGVEPGDDGKSSQVPYPRFKEENARRKTAEAEREAARAEAAEAKKRTATLERLYGKFEKPDAQLEEDATVAEAMWALKDKPEIQAALRLIQEHSKGAKVSERAEKPVETKADPMIEELVRERTKDQLDKVFDEYGVRAQLRGVVSEYVLSQKGLKPTREAVIAAVREYATAQEWTKEFIRGDGKKPKPPVLPNPGGLNAGVASKDKAAAAAEKPKSLSQLHEQNRNRLREGFSRLSS